jgi:hypothetical protein
MNEPANSDRPDAPPPLPPTTTIYAVQRIEVPAGPAEIRHADGRMEHPTVRLEATDVKFLPVAGVVVLVGCALLAAGFFARALLYRELAGARAVDGYRNYSQSHLPLPKQPRLDPLEPADAAAPKYRALDEQMESRLREYGPTEDAGFVHIPIDEAMRLTAEKLRSRTEPAERSPKSRGLVTGGEANSGRVFLGEAR